MGVMLGLIIFGLVVAAVVYLFAKAAPKKAADVEAIAKAEVKGKVDDLLS